MEIIPCVYIAAFHLEDSMRVSEFIELFRSPLLLGSESLQLVISA